MVISNSGEEHNLPFNDIKKEWIIEEEAPTIIVFGFFHLVSLVQNKNSKSKHVVEQVIVVTKQGLLRSWLWQTQNKKCSVGHNSLKSTHQKKLVSTIHFTAETRSKVGGNE